ncbi:GlxA family transcriptional regulator [Sphingopyxis sp. USTB-05]|uniref:GlxA family transcriptional regulator n=1 Tax=Sphingopyxis sp. USTB-05 TaxID=2830667 RepID=UPI0020789E3E|nr:GlxA family transcriptional regulator [Sphingopyxis sp. USTB-05]USI77586.1 GlxA family transcriptional regulator [Sphingopyxis sp. USTB-05]
MRQSDLGNVAQEKSLGYLLVNGFALMSYASVVEPFRAANVLAGRTLHRWTHISTDGGPCHASNGATIIADQGVDTSIDCETLFVFAGGDPTRFSDPATWAWLRKLGRTGTVLAGISGGPYVLAQAGLLDGYRATIHWEHRAAFMEAFPLVTVDPGLFVVDRRRVTCAGGMGSPDLAVDLIERDHGHALAVEVSDWLIRSEPRAADRPQRLSLRDRYGVASDRVLNVLAHMEASVEDPSSGIDPARIAGVSVRQLERLFMRQMEQTVQECYLRPRLEQAAQLLRSTGLSVTDIGVACGFRSTSHFSAAYKARFGRAPSSDRRLTA